MLAEIEKDAIKLIAYIRCGVLEAFDCNKCQNANLHIKRNCEGKEQDKVVFYHPDLGEFTACPLLFIPKHIWEAIDKYDYINKFPHTMPVYEKCDTRLWEFIQHFDYEISNAQDKVRNGSNKKSSSNEQAKMAKLRKRHGVE